MPEPENISDEMSLGTLLDGVAHVSEYFGVWAVQEHPFRTAVERFQRTDLMAHLAAHAGSPELKQQTGRSTSVDQTVVIDLRGPLMKYVSSMSGGTSTVAARRAVRQAAADPDVTAIVLRIDSPGGTASGTKDLADDVAAAAKRKPVYAYIEDLGASAAYWVASQATKVFANETALVGSIGTFMVLEDLSGAAAAQGVKVHVVRAGDFKGAGTEGTEITPAQLAEFQRLVNEMNDHFIRAVAAGRGLSLSATRALADGRVHIGQAAGDLKLIDGVATFDQVLSDLRSKKRSPSMSTTETTPQAATLAELKAALPGASSDFILAQLEAGATIAKASQAWIAEQNRQLAESRQQLADAQKAQAAVPKTEPAKPAGQPALTTAPAATTEASGDPISQWDAAVDAMQTAHPKWTKAQVLAAVNRENPELRTAYVAAYNQQHGRKVAA